MQVRVNYALIMGASLAVLASCGGAKTGNDNTNQFDEMDYALATEYLSLPTAVLVRVPLDAAGNELADNATMRAYEGDAMVSMESDLAGLFDAGRAPGNLISSLTDLGEEGTSTQSWGHWNNQAPIQSPAQGKVVQAPIQAPIQAPVKGGKVVQAPIQAPIQAPVKGGKVVQAPYQTPHQGKVVQAPIQAPVQKCCLAKHDKSKPFFNLFQSRKQRCGALGPLLHPRRCMAVPAQQIPVLPGAPVVIEQPMIVEQPSIVPPGPATLPSYNNTQFATFQPRAFSNVNDNGYWGYEAPVAATYGQTRFYAYPRPACEGADWCALVNN